MLKMEKSMGRKKKEDHQSLTELELKIMTILWRFSKHVSVHDVLEELNDGDVYAYNTISTVIRLLEQKGFVSSIKEGRGHAYLPLISKVEYEKVGLEKVVENLFEGDALSLIRCLVTNNKMSLDELNQIKKSLKGKNHDE
jgi:BlaI family penicillinase repressor